MTQRVRRAERKARQKSGDRGFVYRGAHVYRWADEARAMLARPPEPEPRTLDEVRRALSAEMYGITRSNVRALAHEMGCADLLADALRDVPTAAPMAGLRAWLTEPPYLPRVERLEYRAEPLFGTIQK